MSDRSKRSPSADGVRFRMLRLVGIDAGGLDPSAPVGTSSNPSHQLLTLANLITACRLALTLIFLVLFVGRTHRGVAVACYAVAAITDFLDGQIARRTCTVSWVGKIMDPVMDRVLLFTGVLGLVVTGELPAWVALFVCGRDLYLAVGAAILRKYRRRPLDVIFVGKLATALLMFGFTDLLLGVPVVPGLALFDVPWLPGLNGESVPLGMPFVYMGVIFSAVTAVLYTRAGLAVRREALREGTRHA